MEKIIEKDKKESSKKGCKIIAAIRKEIEKRRERSILDNDNQWTDYGAWGNWERS